MKRLLSFVLSLVVVVCLYYFLFLQPPCSKPLYYDVGSLDPRHAINSEEFLSLIQKAESVWEKPTGKNLFEYKDGAQLSINLVFDEKQAEIIRIAKEEESLDMGREKLAREKEDLDLLQSRYEKARLEFETEVSSWNASPRTSQGKFKTLKGKEAAVNNLSESLKKEIDIYNRLVQEYNQKVQNFNHNADFEGQAGVARGNKEVNIFILNNDESDIFLIAHELGHALGIKGHGKDPQSLMFYKLPEKITKISEEDFSLLSEVCE